MQYYSILFNSTEPSTVERDPSAPAFMSDIHIDSIISEILKGKEEYELEPYFVNKLPDAGAIQYRLDIMKDIDQNGLLDPLNTFSRSMRKVRELEGYSHSSYDKEQRRKWLLDAAFYYCRASLDLHEALTSAEFHSLGLQRFTKWLTDVIEAESFITLSKETFALRHEFDQVWYSIEIENSKMNVNPVYNEKDYCKTLQSVFQHESESDHDDFTIHLFAGVQLSGLELNILNIVKKHYPGPFHKLKSYYSKHNHFINPSIMTFEREVQFYIASLEYFQRLSRKALLYCYPTIIGSKEIHIKAGYDLSLASSALYSDQQIVCNDFDLHPNERICVLTGPNQGGKTTFARSLGQILYLSSIGCPVPCESAEVYLFDQLFTHFPSKEVPGTDTGQLKDELVRLSHIFQHVTEGSVVLLNELFSTTATLDAYAMGRKTIDKFLSLGAFCLFVTHLFDLADAHEQTVSLVATTDPHEPAKRTFHIRRKAADGSVYASSLAEKYGLTRSRMKERIKA